MQTMQEFADEAMDEYISKLAVINKCSLATARRDVLSRMTPNGALAIQKINTEYPLECDEEPGEVRQLVWEVGTKIEFQKEELQKYKRTCVSTMILIEKATDEAIQNASLRLMDNVLTHSEDPEDIRKAMKSAVILDAAFLDAASNFQYCKVMNLHYATADRLPGWTMAWVCLYGDCGRPDAFKAAMYLVRVETLTNLLLAEAAYIMA